jgi:hypothetical protein
MRESVRDLNRIGASGGGSFAPLLTGGRVNARQPESNFDAMVHGDCLLIAPAGRAVAVTWQTYENKRSLGNEGTASRTPRRLSGGRPLPCIDGESTVCFKTELPGSLLTHSPHATF